MDENSEHILIVDGMNQWFGELLECGIDDRHHQGGCGDIADAHRKERCRQHEAEKESTDGSAEQEDYFQGYSHVKVRTLDGCGGDHTAEEYHQRALFVV